MNNRSAPSIGCTLQPDDYQQRLVSIAELARDGLVGMRRQDLRIELTYARSVANRVRELVRNEEQCCAFLNFELSETDEEARLTITVPERTRALADAMFDPFVRASAR